MRLAALFAAAMLAACAAPAGPAAPARQTASPSPAAAGPSVSGIVLDTSGRPLADAAIEIEGTSAGGEKMSYEAVTDSRGRYSVPIASGRYEIRAYAGPIFEGSQWKPSLHPTDDANGQIEVRGAVSKDFVWKLKGPIPGLPPQLPTSYYGARVQLAECVGCAFVARYPGESVISISFTPQAMIDGRAGQPLELRRTVAALYRNIGQGALEETTVLHDIPVGTYVARATLIAPDGRRVALKVTTDAVIAPENFRDSATVTFKPNASAKLGSGAAQALLYLSY